MDKNYLISEIKRTAEENGGIPLGIERFLQETGIRTSDWHGKFWARWGDAVKEAGYEPNTLQSAYSDEYVIEKLISLIKEIGHYPVAGEIKLKAKNDKEFPSHNVFTRVGKKAELAQKIISYCDEHQGFDDIIEICKPISQTQIQQNNTNENSPTDIAYVYLMKSGRYYKIGRTSCIGMREYSIALQLPEKLKKIHEIKTDDPLGIEAYWHKRFKEKRKNGEWFDLSTEEVNAFKRRTFM